VVVVSVTTATKAVLAAVAAVIADPMPKTMTNNDFVHWPSFAASFVPTILRLPL